jgi:D-alanine-D-alanine ligase-like ATP-grasp enzyme
MTDLATARTLHVVAPESLRAWFRHFVQNGAGTDILHIGTDPSVPAAVIVARMRETGATLAVFHSSHETLLRDCALAAMLRSLGYAVLAQSAFAARLGVDKFRMRSFLQRSGLSSLPWWLPGDVAAATPPEATVVVKARSGTQSAGIRLATLRTAAPSDGEFCELYADGTEYSVMVYRDDAGDATLPPVWKGTVSRDLVPPWRRLRLCPAPAQDHELDETLRARGLRTAVAARSAGWVEVEFLVTAAGTPHVLEINPRVAGTMRIASLAAGVLPFGMHRTPAIRGHLAAVRYAAEVPHDGPAVIDPVRSIYSTSRLTLAAHSYRDLAATLSEVTGGPADAALARLAASEDRAGPAVASAASQR